MYFDRISNQLFDMFKHTDELIRGSAFSSFANLILACRGRYFDKILQQLLSNVSQALRSDSSPLVRRAALNMLRSMIASVNSNSSVSMFEVSFFSIIFFTQFCLDFLGQFDKNYAGTQANLQQ